MTLSEERLLILKIKILESEKSAAEAVAKQAVGERDALAKGIGDAAVKVGIIRAGTPLTGPQLLQLCDDIAFRSEPTATCQQCGGSGSVIKPPIISAWSEHGDLEQESCDECSGTGKVAYYDEMRMREAVHFTTVESIAGLLKAKDEWQKTAEDAKARARKAAQTLIAAIGSAGPENVEDAAERAAAVMASLKGRCAHAEELLEKQTAKLETLESVLRAIADDATDYLPDGSMLVDRSLIERAKALLAK